MLRLWFGDQETVVFDATSSGQPIDLTAATVQLRVDPLDRGEPAVYLPAVGSAGSFSVDFDGTLPVGFYDATAEATQAGKTVTYPDAKAGPVRVQVRAKIG